MANTGNSRRKPRKRSPSRRKASTGGGLWPWLVALVLVAGAIAAYDNRARLPGLVAAYLPKPAERQGQSSANGSSSSPSARQKSETAAARPAKPSEKPSTGPIPPAPVGAANKSTANPTAVPVPEGRPGDASPDGKGFSGKFYFCGTSGLDNCVASGDSFWFRKGRLVLADVVAPATENAKCQQERDKGFAAKVRLRDLLNAGPFELSELKGQNVSQTGPTLRVVTRNGRSLGAILVSEGLALPRFGRQQSFCP